LCNFIHDCTLSPWIMAMLQNSLREASYQLLKKGSQNINSLKETEW
jgi:hypothetical protein